MKGRDRRWRKVLLFAAASTSVIGAAAPLCAQDVEAALPPEADSQRGDPSAENTGDQVIVVTGVRASLENAVEIKRQSTQIVDAISSEGIGKLPDLNLAESLTRVPGVQISRSGTRRAGGVTLRGLPGEFSQTTMNGFYLASPDVSGFAYGRVRSEVFSSVEVVKTQGPETISGGLSGTINLRTGNPLDAANRLEINVDGRYEELADSLTPGGAIVLSHQIIPGELAVRAAIGYQNFDYRADNFQITVYDPLNAAMPDVLIPREVRIASDTYKGDDLTGSFGLAWAPSDELMAEVLGFYARQSGTITFNQYLVRSEINVNNPAASQSVRTPLGEPVDGVIQRVRFEDPRLMVDTRLQNAIFETGAITGRLEWTNDDWNIKGGLHYTKARRRNAEFGLVAIQTPRPGLESNGFFADIDTGGGDISKLAYDLTLPREFIVDLTQPLTLTTSAPFRDAFGTTPGSLIQGGYRDNWEDEDELAVQIDVVRNVDFGPIKALRVGGVYRDKSQTAEQALENLFGADLTVLDNSFYNQQSFDGRAPFLNGKFAPAFDFSDFFELDAQRFLDEITPLQNPTFPNANFFVGPNGVASLRDSTALANTYENGQKIYGGYSAIDIEQPITNTVGLRGNAGVRYEFSERATIPGRQNTTLSFEYGNTLPFANLILDVGDNIVVRGSYSNTLRRPQVDSFSVLRSIAVNGVGQVIINLGASDLRPFLSENLDLSFEWYNRRGSSFAAAAFQRRVTDYIDTPPIICPQDGGGFGFGPLALIGNTCRTVGATAAQPALGFPAVPADATVSITQQVNQATFTLRGFELSAVQNFDFLPAPFDGFGGQVNYTYIDVSGQFTLTEVSQSSWNAILYYEKPGFGLRAAINYRGEYELPAGGTVLGAARTVKSRLQLDLSGQVNITDRLLLTAEAFNVTDAQLYEYEDVEAVARNYFIYGRTLTIGARYRF